VSELFLGTGATFDSACRIGIRQDAQWLGSLDVTNFSTRGPHPRVYAADMPQRTWFGVGRAANEDGGRLDAAHAYARAHASYQMPPMYFVPLDDDITGLECLSWAGDLGREHLFLDKWIYSVAWAEVIRTAAS
jgi:hypothetical protein